jgi:hypothetical protein
MPGVASSTRSISRQTQAALVPSRSGLEQAPCSFMSPKYCTIDSNIVNDSPRRHASLCSRSRVELLPLPLACGVAEVVGTAVGANRLSNLLPLDLGQSLVVT